MPIDFDVKRWEKIKDDARRWWTGDLKRPLIHLRLYGADPGRPEPALSKMPRTASYGFAVSTHAIVDRWDYDLSCITYLGDAFPAIIPDFGPGVIAAFMGGKTVVAYDTVWFQPQTDTPINQLTFQPDVQNPWFLHVKELMMCGLERWQGQVQLGMTDLGGNLDILSSFRPGEKLLLDLYDDPEHVKKRTWDAHKAWWFYFDAFNAVLQPVNPGYTAWTPIFSEDPYYMLQCDFCFMIGPDMFDAFVKPELSASCKRLTNPFYHLDGPGQLPHLDSLLTIPELKGVQWVPGSGQPDVTHWAHVYRKIRDAGKFIQFFGTMATFESVVAQLGSAEGIVFLGTEPISREAEVISFLKKYGAA